VSMVRRLAPARPVRWRTGVRPDDDTSSVVVKTPASPVPGHHS
jgi:hypothetical protein